jgi:hypothetical protein
MPFNKTHAHGEGSMRGDPWVGRGEVNNNVSGVGPGVVGEAVATAVLEDDVVIEGYTRSASRGVNRVTSVDSPSPLLRYDT